MLGAADGQLGAVQALAPSPWPGRGKLAEIDRLEADERMSAMLDLPRMRAALENLPDETELDPQKYYDAEFAVPRGLLTARFVNWVEGRNQP